MNVRDLMSQQILEQMVRKVIRGHKVLVVFLTKCPHLWKPPVALDGLVLSDHLAVMVTPRITARPDRSIVNFRDGNIGRLKRNIS